MIRIIAVAPLALLALAACDDSAANEKANAEAKARAEAAAKLDKVKQGVAHNVSCLSALRWQKDTLAVSNIGDLKIYDDYYRAQLDKALGDEVLSGENGAPTLSRANTFDYIEWAYTNDVKTRLAAGADQNGDGKVSPAERNGAGYNLVTACVQEAAERGKGPWAGKDKVGRMYKIEALHRRLVERGT